ncbi:MAG: GFA family protein [Aquisalinus sp.]|nr:GFA family protein [Aquisalinus sp.]
MSITASCHCGKLSAEMKEPPAEAMECNCSICKRKAHTLAFVGPEQVTITADPSDVATYTFNQHKIQHQFCKTCGCSPFGAGEDPSGNSMYAINLRCSDMDLTGIKIHQFDGAAL